MARARGPSGLILRSVFALLGLTLIVPAALRGQGVTTGALSGTVVSSTGESVVGATVVATHEPSGSQYGTVVREGGAYDIRGVRVGGPYTIAVQMLGYETSQETEIFVNLNQTVDTDFTIVPEAVEVAGITVALEADPLLGMAPQLGDVDRHAIQQGVELGLVLAQHIQAVGQEVDALAGEERAQPALHLGALVLAEVDAADLAETFAEGHVVVTRSTNGAHQFTSAAIAPAI